MKFCHLQNNGTEQLGVEQNGRIVNISEALKRFPDSNIPNNVSDLLQTDSSEALQPYIDQLPTQEDSSYFYSIQDCDFGPAVPNPSKIICVGLNYQRHADETGASYPEVPILFNKFNNTLTGHNKDIAIPKVTGKVDYEVELAVVIGKTAKDVPESESLDYVFGYCTANDVSARDLQMRTPQWLLGKTCDDFSPIGPYLVTADEIEDPQHLSLETRVNDEVKQKSNTSDMIFTCQQIISYISKHMTLAPGDVILTGTPEGVMLGAPEGERSYLKAGDTVSVEIEKLGTLTNTFTNEK
ncbi:fumarylacetoacetate hydrolase family protein [Salibacterium aidingense]|uniref:fumarylacetoacetate hydrolase family protein n=1 Tax=Salibacterium aidingense TaxID=384933 RepID=UPI00041BA664|nr:fumarylacetoacetate hydrolase family protein [Salibacterium aidingense]